MICIHLGHRMENTSYLVLTNQGASLGGAVFEQNENYSISPRERRGSLPGVQMAYSQTVKLSQSQYVGELWIMDADASNKEKRLMM